MHKGQAAEEGDKIHSCHDRGNKLLRNNSFFRCLNREFRRIDEEGEHQQEHGDNERIIGGKYAFFFFPGLQADLFVCFLYLP